MNNQIDLFIDLGKIINRIAAKLFWGVTTHNQCSEYQLLSGTSSTIAGRGDDSVCPGLRV